MLFIEYSRVPVWLSKLAPIEINAICLGPVVFSRGKISQRTKNHERIHWEQMKETAIIGFLLIYLYDYLYNRYALRMEGSKAYRNTRAEIEAYGYQTKEDYLLTRKRFTWLSP